MAMSSATDRRSTAKASYDAFLASCPTRQLLTTLSSKWVGLVLAALADGPHRYSELASRIDGVSQKMLTQTLRTLEHDGLLTRTVTPSVPVRVDYALSDLGDSLLPVVTAIKTWAEAHVDEVRAARQTAVTGSTVPFSRQLDVS
ncbi:MAG: winged helix-turn-helix transcriptional regulator [Acidimicrobiales bacterium]